MESSAAARDNYQPVPEDRVERKERMGGGGEVSCRRREREIEVRGRWAHEES